MGVRTTLVAAPVTAAHASAAQKIGLNASGLAAQLAEQISEVIYLLKEIIKTVPAVNLTAAGTISTSSATIAMAQPLPASVVFGMNVFSVTANKQIGTVLSTSGSTLTLTAVAANAGSGSSDVLQIADANLSVYQSLLTALS
jgi:hypothetical protein